MDYVTPIIAFGTLIWTALQEIAIRQVCSKCPYNPNNPNYVAPPSTNFRSGTNGIRP